MNHLKQKTAAIEGLAFLLVQAGILVAAAYFLVMKDEASGYTILLLKPYFAWKMWAAVAAEVLLIGTFIWKKRRRLALIFLMERCLDEAREMEKEAEGGVSDDELKDELVEKHQDSFAFCGVSVWVGLMVLFVMEVLDGSIPESLYLALCLCLFGGALAVCARRLLEAEAEVIKDHLDEINEARIGAGKKAFIYPMRFWETLLHCFIEV